MCRSQNVIELFDDYKDAAEITNVISAALIF
nr:MAG TPA: hypothetical protein [Caudoviricetes sp.]